MNNHPLSYIKQRMADFDLINDIESEDKLRFNVSLPWIKNNVMVFRYKNPRNCTES